jgi:hypothetical protein
MDTVQQEHVCMSITAGSDCDASKSQSVGWVGERPGKAVMQVVLAFCCLTAMIQKQIYLWSLGSRLEFSSGGVTILSNINLSLLV